MPNYTYCSGNTRIAGIFCGHYNIQYLNTNIAKPPCDAYSIAVILFCRLIMYIFKVVMRKKLIFVLALKRVFDNVNYI